MQEKERERWPKGDEIRWIEHELLRAKHGADWEKSALADDPKCLEVWLAHVRDKQSWKEIGDKYFPKLKHEARRSEARRAHARIERYFKNPNAPEFYEHHLRRLIIENFGVSPEAFRMFILKGHLPRKD